MDCGYDSTIVPIREIPEYQTHSGALTTGICIKLRKIDILDFLHLSAFKYEAASFIG